MNTPCKDCSDRYPGCHDHCERYQAERKRRAEQIAKYKALHNGESQLKAMYANKLSKKIKKYGGDLW